MLNDLVVIHIKRTAENPATQFPLGLQWSTCLRGITFLNGSEFSITRGMAREGHEIYRGHEAYRFVLEVVCGIHSPMIGETEVMGQFRDFCFNADYPDTAWGNFLQQLNNDILTDAKRVRHQFLHNLGSQSYGSLAHRFLKELPSITLIGAGKLVREMLPWLAGEKRVRVVNRSLDSPEALRREFPGIETADLDAVDAHDPAVAGLVIAAPLSALEIERWIARQGTSFARTLDLRGESAGDPLTLDGEVIDLNGFFALLEDERRRARDVSEKARIEIDRRAELKLKQVQCRPFGWEDLCA